MYNSHIAIVSILLTIGIAIIPYTFNHFQVLKAQMNMTSSSMNMSAPVNYNSIKFITYKNPTLGIQILHPISWKPIENKTSGGGHIIEFMPAVESEHQQLMPFMTLSLEKVSDKVGNLKSLTNQNLQVAKSMPGFHLINSSDIVFSGVPAHKITYTFNSPVPMPSEFQSMNIWTIKGNTAYTISYSEAKSEFLKHLPGIEKMVRSLEITK